ncbi:MAG: heparinase II/III domain-containing protein, partial [Thermoguttaceae bacterium]
MSLPSIHARRLATLILLAAAGTCAAEPCTLYKPRHIATAKANIERYAWAKGLLGSYRGSMASVMKRDREFFRQIIPDLTPGSTYGQVCPACVNQKCSMGETGVWLWSISQPDTLRCKYCRTEYPNEKYPETGRLDCPRMGQSFTYYINPQQQAHPGEDPGKYAYVWAGRPVQVSFSGVIRSEKLSWALHLPLPLAKLYALTGEAAYAERTAWILERLAEVYPRYLYHSYGGCFADMDPAEVAREMGRNPRAGKFAPGTICHPAEKMRVQFKDGSGALDAGFWGAGRFTTGAGGEGDALLAITVAYDLTRDAKHPDGRPVYTSEMTQRITQDLILAGCADLENYNEINNKCGPSRALSGAVGILFGQPERVRRAMEGIDLLLQDCFHFDGFCKESPSYSSMHLGNMGNIPDLLSGYSDPPGYVPPTGQPWRDFDAYQHLARYRLALQSMAQMLRPDRLMPVIGDTHSGSGLSAQYAEILADHYGPRYAGLLETALGGPLEKNGGEYALWHRDPDLPSKASSGESATSSLPIRTEYFPGWQVGVLRSGNDSSQTAFYFNGYCDHGHRHYDTLGLVYHAFNQELASDRGYIWDDPRNAWTKSTLAHNLVTVDGHNQDAKGRHSRLELFGVSPAAEVIQASADAYAACSEYRRTCVLVRLPDGGNYVVDLFRVEGGKVHQYGLNCNGRFLGLQGVEAAPLQEEIRWLANLRAAPKPPELWNAAWECEGKRLQLWMAGSLDRIVVADAPGWRSYRGDQLSAPPITQILAERRAAGKDSLQSTYAAVICPFQGEASPIRSVRLVAAESGTEQAMAVAIGREGATDYVVSCLDDEPHQFGPVRMAGRFGMATIDDSGRLMRAYLLEGTELSVGDRKLTAPSPRLTRKIIRVDDRQLELDEPLPAAMARPGRYFLTGQTGFEIESTEGNRLTV